MHSRCYRPHYIGCIASRLHPDAPRHVPASNANALGQKTSKGPEARMKRSFKKQIGAKCRSSKKISLHFWVSNRWTSRTWKHGPVQVSLNWIEFLPRIRTDADKRSSRIDEIIGYDRVAGMDTQSWQRQYVKNSRQRWRGARRYGGWSCISLICNRSKPSKWRKRHPRALIGERYIADAILGDGGKRDQPCTHARCADGTQMLIRYSSGTARACARIVRV